MKSVDRIRPDIVTMEPYTPIYPFEVLAARLGREPDEIIKLDANENPYGPSPRVRSALADMPFVHVYPDPESRALRAGLRPSRTCLQPSCWRVPGPMSCWTW